MNDRQPAFYVGQRVATTDSAFKGKVGYVREYIAGENYPYAVAFGFKEKRSGSEEWDEYGFRESELIDASDGQMILWDNDMADDFDPADGAQLPLWGEGA